MAEERVSVERLRVASPCPVSWETMRGDERVRFCEQCSLHVYNISALTRRQAEALISEREGRFCARLYRRADGTVITKDCPVGLRALRRRAAKVAGAVATALLSLSTCVLGRTAVGTLRAGGSQPNSAGRLYNRAEISGRVLDPNGVPIEGAEVRLSNLETGKKAKALTDAKGRYRFAMLSPGRYTIEASAALFRTYMIADIKLGASETFNQDLILEVTGLMGIITVEEPKASYKGPGISTVFSGDKARKLPF
ncbi:MAG: carboxypeptidase regulatory-like domain-containing protein [Acidobacteria bacterium]|nr:carboxypeptidase regulatory-like domain-containing protein [Acidobacteriota bacterium]